MSGIPLLSELIFIPAAAALLLSLVPRKFERAIFVLGLVAMAWALGLSIHLFGEYLPSEPGYAFREMHAWIPSYGVAYLIGVDGISLVLMGLTTLLSFLALLTSFNSVRQRRKEFILALLFLETAMLGTFAALDLFLFYVFWEAMLIPMVLLIGVFGGPRRVYATVKFFLYTMAGSVLMLMAILALYVLHANQYGVYTTALADLLRVELPLNAQLFLYVAFLSAFLIKLPVVPVHTWLPDAHVEAPTAGSVLLAGILLKFGGYGVLRFAIPLFPQAAAAAAPYVGIIGVVGIIYGAYLSLAQEDMKKLIAYSSVSHMGFVALGLASLTQLGLSGALFQMVAHGLSTGALFLLVGMMYERRHTRMIEDYGGLARVTPRLATAFFIVLLASIGLPGLCGFVGEFLILNGAFHGAVLGHPAILVAVSTLGLVLGAGYMLILYERVFLGEVKFEENRKMSDLSLLEGCALAVPIALMIWLGVRPGIVLKRIEPAVRAIVERVNAPSPTASAEGVLP